MKLNFNHVQRGCLFLLFVLLGSASIMAQTSVSGTITDAESGDPLIGASVLVTGTSTGTVTDFDGNFTLNVPQGAESLTVSYTGYATQTIPFTGQNTLNVTMTSGELLDEVVVVGYGTVTQKQVTSAVTSIDAEDFNAGNINDPTQLIQGKVAGLTISKVGGNVNDGATIRLRGLSSFGGNTSPLIIIDGVVGANLRTVDPADIESINVLKDGSAAAIYGIQASAGVIIVTTKRGREGQGQLDYRGYVSAESVAKQPELANRDEYLRLLGRAAELNRAQNPDQPDLPTPEAVRAANDYGGDTDWVDLVTRTGISHVHNLSYSGGANGMTYRASVNYRDIQGIGFINDGFRQLNGRLSISQRALNDKLSLSLDVTATDRKSDFFDSNVFKFATTYNPTAPVRIGDAGFNVPDAIAARANAVYGGYFQVENFDYINPVSIAEQQENNQQRTDLLYSFKAGYDLTDDWVVNLSYSRQRENNTGGFFGSRTSLANGGAGGSSTRLGNASRYANDNRNELFEATTTYNLDLGTNNLELLAGYSWQEYNFQNFSAGGRGLPSDVFSYNLIGSLNDISEGLANLGSSQSGYKVIGFFGRARLGIGTAYNITASIRRDGTSRNAPNNRWDIFPAISASADLVDALALTGPNELKFRVGYGVTGTLPPGDIEYLATFGPGGFFPVNGVYLPTIAPQSNPNANLRFEKKGEFNAGLDFAFMDYRLTGSLDFYVRNTSDLLFSAQLPTPPFLFETVQANLNNVDLVNTGVELSLGYNVTAGSQFTWNPQLTLSTFNTKIEQNDNEAEFNFGDGGSVDLFSTVPGAPGQNGFPVTTIEIGQEFGGLYTLIIDEAASTAEGRYVYVEALNVDTNGDGIGDAADGVLNNADRVRVGNGLPDFSLGFANSFTYGPVDFSFFLRGDFGHDLVNMPRNFYGQLGNAVSRPIDNIILTDLNESIISAPRLNQTFVEDASFLALDNAQLGYTFTLGGNSGFRSLRAYIAGQNLFYITGYTGVDPNVRFTDNGNALAPGIDRRNTFFRTRTATFGVSVGF
ncbi:SusC/RagA family TonB-linked outer membrane protein [Lewinella sp. JB7]|uniref:SusC/RagA family TonB-linked outer membrane protein n=1 Tax=Lewinella sp. JB7 TaxID=2962887 RepID=UPI0020C96A7A|nr:SusC/RagA family TonB-linked outer membrane protein [Lewinella sp. JB7]MCP9235174.1 SusC/RagA family TonB-linked outer membrane protein [Lewinella sp. JB7]